MQHPITDTLYFNGHPIRKTNIAGKDWYATGDVLFALEHPKPSHTFVRKKLKPPHKMMAVLEDHHVPKVLACKEGIKHLARRSAMPKAVEFREWFILSEDTQPALAQPAPASSPEMVVVSLEDLKALIDTAVRTALSAQRV